MINVKKIIAILLSLFVLITTIPTVPVFADEQDILAQYNGSTTASYGYKPNCTFTVNKIVNNKFIGRFTAMNLEKVLRGIF